MSYAQHARLHSMKQLNLNGQLHMGVYKLKFVRQPGLFTVKTDLAPQQRQKRQSGRSGKQLGKANTMRDPGPILIDSLDKPNASPQGPGQPHPLTPIARRDERSHRLPAQAWIILTIAMLIVLAFVLWGVYSAIQALLWEYPWVSAVMGLLLLLVACVAILALGYTLVARLYYWVQGSRIIRTAFDTPVDSMQVLNRDPLAMEAPRLAYETAKIAAMEHPLITTWTSPQTAQPKAEPPLLLTSGLSLVPDREWLSWIDATPHLMIAGRTAAGKTTLATAILASRTSEHLCVIDPHDTPGKWFGGTAIGGGREYDAIFAALAGLLSEMDTRYDRFNRGETHFDRLTTLIDEVPAIVLYDEKAWTRFASQLGSEARKVNMSMVLLTQSHLVQNIKINSVMRENFTRIALGDQASALLSEETDRSRKQALQELLKGQAYPAAMEYRGEIHLLDTASVPSLARNAGPARLWVPPMNCPKVTQESATIKLLTELKARGLSRDEVRKFYPTLKFENKTWGEV